MEVHKLNSRDAVNWAIGQAVSSLLAAGLSVGKDNILNNLRESEKNAIDGMRQVYIDAISFVSLQENKEN